MKNPKPLHAVRFEADGHLYYGPDGKIVPSRGELLAAEGFGWEGPEGMHTLRGRFVHDCNAAIIDDDLDDDSVPAEYQGYVAALRSFYNAHRDMLTVVACEIPLYHPWGYGVTPDIVVVKTGNHLPTRFPIEIKSGGDDRVDLQLAAQVLAWNVNFPEQPCDLMGASLCVRPDGTYQFKPHAFLEEAVADFMAIVRVNQRRRRENR